MKTKRNDNNSFSPYKYNKDVEKVVLKSYVDYLSARLDKALEMKDFINDLSNFQKLVNLYLEAKKELNNLLTKD